MSQAALLAYLSEQAAPLTETQVTAHFGLKLTDAALCENVLLTMMYDGALSEPLGEFRGYAITDQGRELLAELTKPVANKPAQKAMF